jgi:hypothetical protein
LSDNDSTNKPQSQPVTLGRVLEILDKGTIDTEHGLLRWSSNHTFLLSITQQNMSVMAVYKPQSGERPLWDFPDGTLYKREVATFLTSQALGWPIIPPTVIKKGTHGPGSVQFFIDHDPEYNYFAFDDSMIPQLMRLALFDSIINNADRKGGHCLVDRQGHLWGIDHGLSFHPSPKLRTVIWDFAGEEIPSELLTEVEKLHDSLTDRQSNYTQALAKLLETGEMAALQRRVARLLKSQHYPHPGNGPSYPWPPV